MNTIIMIFALPIGIYLLMQEKKSMQKYQAIFDDFYQKVNTDSSLNTQEKLNLLEKMLYQNNYKITKKEKNSVTGEKKIFSIGWLFIGIGTFYVGLIFYILYYLYMQKPHVVNFMLYYKKI